jgi:glycosyltransferase involved in cell wall biosynthesis
MKIAIDAAPLSSNPTGIHNYIINILHNIGRLNKSDHFIIYGIQNGVDISDLNFPNFEIKRPCGARRGWGLWYYTGFPIQFIREKIDIYFSMYQPLPLYVNCPRIAVIYDLIPVLTKVTPDPAIMFHMQLIHTIISADKILTISNATKQDLIHTYKAKSSKIEVIYPAYNKKDYFVVSGKENKARIDAALNKYHIDNEFILYAGSLQTNKNIPRLIQAFATLKNNHGMQHKLVLAGKPAWGDSTIIQNVRDLRLENEVIITGYVTKEDLPLLMNGAAAFVFPSLYEGFGIPPLEAMACGTPVIASNIAPLLEVVGDAGMMINPYNVNETAEAIYKVYPTPIHGDGWLSRDLKGLKPFLGREPREKH